MFNGKIFTALYFIGIVLALLLALSGGQSELFTKPLAADYSHLILPISIGHMLLLVLFGSLLPQAAREQAGNRMQTAGYLHTLIGFSIALLHINGESFALAAIMNPLGSALITSIIGWFVGGELVASGTQRPIGVDSEMERLALELNGFCDAVETVHKKYIIAINGAAREYESIQRQQGEIISKSSGSMSDIDRVLSRIMDSVELFTDSIENCSKEFARGFGDEFESASKQVLINSQAHAEALKSAAEEARNTSQYLSESRVLINELERLLDHVVAVKTAP